MKWDEPQLLAQADGTFIWEVLVHQREPDGEFNALKIRSDCAFDSEDLAVVDCARYIEEHEAVGLS